MPPKKYVSESSDDEKPIARKLNKKTPPVSNTKPKKEESNYSDSDSPPLRQTKPKKQDSTPTPTPTDDKKNLKRKRGAEKVVVEEAKKRVKKVYDLPGQKRDPPEERDPLRIFYETLYHQKPGSELAAVWMMESGLLPLDVAKKVYETKMKKTKNQWVGSPTKVVKTVRETHSVTVKKKVEASTKTTSVKKKTIAPASASKQPKKQLKPESSEEDPTSDEYSSSEEEYDTKSQKSGKKTKAN